MLLDWGAVGSHGIGLFQLADGALEVLVFLAALLELSCQLLDLAVLLEGEIHEAIELLDLIIQLGLDLSDGVVAGWGRGSRGWWRLGIGFLTDQGTDNALVMKGRALVLTLVAFHGLPEVEDFTTIVGQGLNQELVLHRNEWWWHPLENNHTGGGFPGRDDGLNGADLVFIRSGGLDLEGDRRVGDVLELELHNVVLVGNQVDLDVTGGDFQHGLGHVNYRHHGHGRFDGAGV